ncbi:hypothetical protein GF327_08750 [Candidatus Woesearchaeota archaeon]|nr:hypothetical protein [Candidatus Woesearchaeota archaeon]
MELKKYLFLIVFCILVYSADAASIDDISENVDEISAYLKDFFEGTPKENIEIVIGENVRIEDKVLFNMIKSQSPELQGIEIISDDNQEEIEGKSLVLIGSKKTNRITKNLGTIDSFETKKFSPIILRSGNLDDGSRALVVYTEREDIMLENNAVKRSPLKKFMDEKYIPAAATLLSIFLLYLWRVLSNTLIEIFNDFISSKILQKKTEGKTTTKKKVHKIKPHEFISLSEIIAFILFVGIFAIVQTWTWVSDFSDFKSLFIVNLIVIGIISFLREFVRLVFCFKKKLRSEFVFWPFGTFLTIASTYLGNTFSMISYTLLDEDEADEKIFGKGSLVISLFTYLIVIFCYILNLFNPSIYLQMSFVYAQMILFIELFPMEPMAGYDIKKWNFFIWIIIYILCFLSYVYLNFTVYV